MNLSINRIIIHPDFSPGNRAHDIALLELSNPVRFERRISPICLATPNTRYLGQVATVYSWTQAISKNETTDTSQTIKSCRPRKLGLPILGYEECLNAASNSNYVSIDKGCIGVIGSFSPICEVDSGGAVTFRSRQGVYELIGILSDKNVCDSAARPSVALYTTINDHISWITQNTRDACYCVKT
nr:vitamin K-dependent protein C-like [Leptinotarsa decemlineata]